MSTLDISIVILNYNTFDLTVQCVKSVLEKTSGVSYEVIVVDNASPEGRADDFKKEFPEIVLIKSEKNMGFAKGNNLGVAAARGQFILLLNSDTLLRSNVAETLRNFLVAQQHVAAVSARLEYPDGNVQHCCQRFPSVKYRLFELFRLQKVFRNSGGRILMGSFFDHKSIAYPDWIWGTCFMFRKDLLKQLPGEKLADEFFMYGEDMQWCMEFRKRGYSIAFESAAVVVHLMGKSAGAKNELMNKNRQSFMNLYYSPFHQWCIRVLDKLLA